MRELNPVSFHVEAAKGWLGIGLPLEAEKELDEIPAELRGHPDVLLLRYEICSQFNKWEAAAEIAQALCTLVPHVPIPFIHLAFALHELKRTSEALNVLLPVVSRFPEEPTIAYNLACYHCRLGQKKEALDWLGKAIALTGAKEIKLRALQDPDLETLRADIADISDTKTK